MYKWVVYKSNHFFVQIYMFFARKYAIVVDLSGYLMCWRLKSTEESSSRRLGNKNNRVTWTWNKSLKPHGMCSNSLVWEISPRYSQTPTNEVQQSFIATSTESSPKGRIVSEDIQLHDLPLSWSPWYKPKPLQLQIPRPEDVFYSFLCGLTLHSARNRSEILSLRSLAKEQKVDQSGSKHAIVFRLIVQAYEEAESGMQWISVFGGSIETFLTDPSSQEQISFHAPENSAILPLKEPDSNRGVSRSKMKTQSRRISI